MVVVAVVVVVVVVVVVLAVVIVVGGGDASGGGGGVERAIFRWEDVVARDFNFGVLGFVEREKILNLEDFGHLR